MYYWLIHLKQECFSSPLKKKKTFHIKAKLPVVSILGKNSAKIRNIVFILKAE